MDLTLSLLLLCVAAQYVSSERFFVITSPNNPCPGKYTGEPCLTITQFASGSYTRFLSDPSVVSNITLDLQPGEHIMFFHNFHVQNVDSFVLKATGAVLDCRNGYFNISNVQYVHISGIKFINCTKNIVIKSVGQLLFENCTLNHLEGLRIADTIKAEVARSSFSDSKQIVHIKNTTAMIGQCMFTNNCIGIFGENAYITVYQVTFRMNTADCIVEPLQPVQNGGAIYVRNNVIRVREGDLQSKILTIINSTFKDNTARQTGGAIYVSGTNIKVNGSTFINNTANLQGGAVHIASTSTSTRSTSVIDKSKFIGNHARLGGGAIYAPASVRISESSFVSNTARLRGGGAVYTGGRHSSIVVTESSFHNNSAAYCGVFDIDEFHHSVIITSSSFFLNTAMGGSDISDILSASGIRSDVGGVICVRNASVSILNSNFTHNSATGYGGMMYVDDSTIAIERSVFDSNRAGYGGGVTCTEQHRVQLKITLSSFTNNQAQGGEGGVMYVGRAHSHVRISESSFGFNSATERGGVVVVYGGVLEVNKTNFYSNTAGLGGGIGSTCNSKTNISNEVMASTDPDFSFCTLYDEHADQYDDTTAATTTEDPLPTTATYEPTTDMASPTVPSTTASDESTTTKTISPDYSTTAAPTTTATTTQQITTVDATTKIVDETTAAATDTSSTLCTINSPLSVYFELNGSIYLNNSIISLQEVGEGDNALICHTNKQDCCDTLPNRLGEFYYPNGEQVPIRNRGDEFYRQRGDGEIYLNRRIETTSPVGRYSCVIPDATQVSQTLYIDLL